MDRPVIPTIQRGERIVRPVDRRPPQVQRQRPAYNEPRSWLLETPDWFTSVGPVDVSIIVPLYKSVEVVVRQIASWDLGDPTRHEIIYLDDACPQGSHAEIVPAWEARRGELAGPVGKIIRNDHNGGYGPACNAGAKFASGKYLLFLNADTTVTPDWLRPLYEFMESNPRAGLAGNMQIKVREGKTTIDSAGSEWSWVTSNFDHIGRHVYRGKTLAKPFELERCPHDLLETAEREMVTGCCFIIRADLFRRLDGFDAGFRVGYWEDSDLNLRVRREGYKIYFVPDSRIFHDVGHTKSGGHPFMAENREYFRRKWVGNGAIDKYVAPRPKPFALDSALIWRDGAGGDVLAAASVAAAIKHNHPKCRITFRTKIPHLLDGNPYIDAVTTGPSQGSFQETYDLNLAYERHPRRHMLDCFADAAGVYRPDCKLFFRAERYEPLPSNYVVIAAGVTNWAGRNWHAGKFNEVISWAKSLGFSTVAVGNSHDGRVPLCDLDYDLRGVTTLPQSAYVIRNARLFLGIDSLPMWIAQTYDVPGVAFFGSVRPEFRVAGKMRGVNAGWLPCIGCHHDQRAPAVNLPQCKMGHTFCEDEVNANMMIEAAAELLKGEAK
jgi:GT2 family glycosyltransferase/ADP-heptose:LPS heptosyltransferase